LQLHWRETFVPKRISELTNDQQSKVLQSHMFVVRKLTGETKARVVAGGNLQRGHVTKEQSSSPTVSTIHRVSPVNIDCRLTRGTRRCNYRYTKCIHPNASPRCKGLRHHPHNRCYCRLVGEGSPEGLCQVCGSE
jgi:hypothetical protein